MGSEVTRLETRVDSLGQGRSTTLDKRGASDGNLVVNLLMLRYVDPAFSSMEYGVVDLT